MTAYPLLIRNPMQPAGEPSVLLLHHGKAYQSRPAPLYVDGPFFDDGAGGAIAAAIAVGGSRGHVTARGEWIVAPTLQDARPVGPDGLAPLRDQDRWGYRNLKGAIVQPRPQTAWTDCASLDAHSRPRCSRHIKKLNIHR